MMGGPLRKGLKSFKPGALLTTTSQSEQKQIHPQPKPFDVTPRPADDRLRRRPPAPPTDQARQ
jgi:hypothetical protein